MRQDAELAGAKSKSVDSSQPSAHSVSPPPTRDVMFMDELKRTAGPELIAAVEALLESLQQEQCGLA